MPSPFQPRRPLVSTLSPKPKETRHTHTPRHHRPFATVSRRYRGHRRGRIQLPFKGHDDQRQRSDRGSVALGPYRRDPPQAWSNCASKLVRTITTSSRWSNLFILKRKLFDTLLVAA